MINIIKNVNEFTLDKETLRNLIEGLYLLSDHKNDNEVLWSKRPSEKLNDIQLKWIDEVFCLNWKARFKLKGNSETNPMGLRYDLIVTSPKGIESKIEIERCSLNGFSNPESFTFKVDDEFRPISISEDDFEILIDLLVSNDEENVFVNENFISYVSSNHSNEMLNLVKIFRDCKVSYRVENYIEDDIERENFQVKVTTPYNITSRVTLGRPKKK